MAKILVSNDDGHYSTGIRTLAETLARKHEVIIAAPDRERSAMGHALTLHKPLRVDEITDIPPNIKKAYSVTGTPSDCVKISLNALLDEPPDLVISGINHGPNLGFDVLYSGTVSAALEGALHGIPSVAISLLNGFEHGADFRHAADFILDFVPLMQHTDFPERTIMNVNFPAVPLSDICGVKMTHLGLRMYTDTYEKRVDPRNQVYYWLAGEIVGADDSPDSDITTIRNNMISITPITFDLTNQKVIEQYNEPFAKHLAKIWQPKC